MYRLCALLAAVLLSLAWQAPARASGDFGCTQEWKLKHKAMTGCADMAMLGPGNDTRVNLSLLLLDMRPGKPAERPAPPLALFDWLTFQHYYFPQADRSSDTNYAEGEGSRCRSNDSRRRCLRRGAGYGAADTGDGTHRIDRGAACAPAQLHRHRRRCGHRRPGQIGERQGLCPLSPGCRRLLRRRLRYRRRALRRTARRRPALAARDRRLHARPGRGEPRTDRRLR